MIRHHRLVSLVALLTFLVVACSGAEESSQDDNAGSGGSTPQSGSAGQEETAAEDTRTDVELNFTIWAAGDAIDNVWGGLAAEFAEQDPRVSAVNIEFVPFSRYHDVLNVRLSSGEVQNGGWLLVHLAAKYIDSGVLMDLGPVFRETEGYDFDDIFTAALETWSRGDAVYAYPFAQSPMIVFWNKDMFASAGVKTPSELIAEGNWTWEAVADLAQELKASGVAEYGFDFQVDLFAPQHGWKDMDVVYSAYQGRPWSDDGTSCTLDSPEMVDAMSLIHRMVFTDGTVAGPGEVNPSIWRGESPMGIYHNAAAVPQSADATFEYGMVPQPAGPGGFPADWHPSVNTSGFVIYEDAPNSDIAAEFLAWATNPENAKRIATLHSSPRASVLEPGVFTQNLRVSEDEAQAAILDALEVGWRGPAHSNWEPVYRESNTTLDQQLWKADADVQAALTAACSAIEDLLG